MGRSLKTGSNSGDQRDSLHWTIFKVSNKLLRASSVSVYIVGFLLLIINQTPSVDSICVWQGGGGFRLACGFRQSGLFRLRSLGGLKGWAGAGFTIGDEDGFKDSLTNTEQKPGYQAQASQKQQQYQRLEKDQQQQLLLQQQLRQQQQPSQFQNKINLVGQQNLQTGRQQTTVFNPHAGIKNSGVQKRASLWNSWKWPSISKKRPRMPPPPQRIMHRQQRPEPVVPYGRAPPYRQQHQPQPPPMQMPKPNQKQPGPIPPRHNPFQQNNYPHVDDGNLQRKGNAIPSFSPMPEMKPIPDSESASEEVQETQISPAQLKVSERPQQLKKPYGLRLLENSKNYGRKYMVKPSIPIEESESSTTPDVPPNLGYDTNLFPDIYFTTPGMKDLLNKMVNMEYDSTTEALMKKLKLKKVKVLKKGSSKNRFEKTSPIPQESTLQMTTTKSTKGSTSWTSPSTPNTSPSTANTSPSTVNTSPSTVNTSPSTEKAASTSTVSTSPSTTKTTTSLATPFTTTTANSTTTKKIITTTSEKTITATPEVRWEPEFPQGQDQQYYHPELDDWDSLPSDWNHRPSTIQRNSRPPSTSTPQPSPPSTTREPPPSNQWDVPIRREPPRPPNTNSEDRLKPILPGSPKSNSNKEVYPPWDYDDKPLYQLELPQHLKDKENDDGNEWHGSYSHDNYNTRVKPLQILRKTTTTEKMPSFFHDFSTLSLDPIISSAKWTEFYDPRYPPDHEINQGKLSILKAALSTTTPPPQPPFYKGNNYFNPKNHFSKDSTLRTTVSLPGLSEDDGLFVKFDSRESENLLSKTKAYNQKFYSSHFNKSAGMASLNLNSYDHDHDQGDIVPVSRRPLSVIKTSNPVLEYPKPVDIGWHWEHQKRLDNAYAKLSEPDKLIPTKLHNHKQGQDYFDPDMIHVASSTPMSHRWSGISRKSFMAGGHYDDDENESEEIQNILNKKALTIGANNNWDPPSFWGPHMDRFIPATDFVTNDNFKIPKFDLDLDSKKSNRPIKENKPNLDYDDDINFSSTKGYNDNAWREFSSANPMLNHVVTELPFHSHSERELDRLRETINHLRVTSTTSGPFKGERSLLESSEKVEIMRNSSDHHGISVKNEDINLHNRNENGKETSGHKNSDVDYDRESNLGFAGNWESEVKKLTQEVHSMLSGSFHKEDENLENENDAPVLERTTEKEMESSTSKDPEDNGKSRPQGSGLVKVIKHRKLKKKKQPSTFLSISSPIPSTESAVKFVSTVPPMRIQPPPLPDPKMYSYHIPPQSLGPPPTPPDASHIHLNDFSLPVNQHDHMKTEWNLYPFPQLVKEIGMPQGDIFESDENRHLQYPPENMNPPPKMTVHQMRVSTLNPPVFSTKKPTQPTELQKHMQTLSPNLMKIKFEYDRHKFENGQVHKNLRRPPQVELQVRGEPLEEMPDQQQNQSTLQNSHGTTTTSRPVMNIQQRQHTRINTPKSQQDHKEYQKTNSLQSQSDHVERQIPQKLNTPQLQFDYHERQSPQRTNSPQSQIDHPERQIPQSSNSLQSHFDQAERQIPPKPNSLQSQFDHAERQIPQRINSPQSQIDHPERQILQRTNSLQSQSDHMERQILLNPNSLQSQFDHPERQIPQMTNSPQSQIDHPERQIPQRTNSLQSQSDHTERQIPLKPNSPQSQFGHPERQIPQRTNSPQSGIDHPERQIPQRTNSLQSNFDQAERQIPNKMNAPPQYLPDRQHPERVNPPQPDHSNLPLPQMMNAFQPGVHKQQIPKRTNSPDSQREQLQIPAQRPSEGPNVPIQQLYPPQGPPMPMNPNLNPKPSRRDFPQGPAGHEQNLIGQKLNNMLRGPPPRHFATLEQLQQHLGQPGVRPQNFPSSQQQQPPLPPRMIQPIRHILPSPFPATQLNLQMIPPAPFPAPQFHPSSNPKFQQQKTTIETFAQPPPQQQVLITKKPVPVTTTKPLTRKESLRLALETLSHARSDDIESIVNEQYGGELPGGIVKIVSTLPPHLVPTTSTTTTAKPAPPPVTTATPQLQPVIKVITFEEMASNLAPLFKQPPNQIPKIVQLQNMSQPKIIDQLASSTSPSETYQYVDLPLDDFALLASAGKDGSTEYHVEHQIKSNPPVHPPVQSFESMLDEALEKAKQMRTRPEPPTTPEAPTIKATATATSTTAPLVSVLSQMGILQKQPNSDNAKNVEALKKFILLKQLDSKLDKLRPDFPEKENVNQQAINFNNILTRLAQTHQPQPQTMLTPATTLKNLQFAFPNPSMMSLLGQQLRQVNNQNKLNPLPNQFVNNNRPSTKLDNPTLLALQALALKRIQNIQPSPQLSFPQQVASEENSGEHLGDFVDLGPILSLGHNRRSSSQEDDRPKTRILQVRNAPRSYYPSNTELSFDQSSKRDLYTDFRCEDQKYFPGLYADSSNSCKVFHLCAKTDSGFMTKTFRCPQETVFDQEVLRCNWGLYVNCAGVQDKYHFNKYLSQSFQFLKTLGEFSASYNSMNGTLAA